MNEIIDTHSLKLAASYIECVREILKDLWAAGVIPRHIEEKYKLKKLENGLIDIQNP
jgi:hypothetical protein